MSDMVQEMNDYAKYDMDDEEDKSIFEKIEAMFQELVDNTIIGDIVEAWDLFHWMKVEKQAFNKIVWKKAYRETKLGVGGNFAGIQELVVKTAFHFGVKPDITLDGEMKYFETPLKVRFTYK